jgi:hypothetical protein
MIDQFTDQITERLRIGGRGRQHKVALTPRFEFSAFNYTGEGKVNQIGSDACQSLRFSTTQ